MWLRALRRRSIAQGQARLGARALDGGSAKRLQPRRCVHGARGGGGQADRLPKARAGQHILPCRLGAAEEEVRARRYPQGRDDQHLRLGSAHGARAHLAPGRLHGARPRDHWRDCRGRPRRRVHEGGRPLLGSVQHCLRPVPRVQAGRHGCLPVREPRPRRSRVRLRRHGRLGGRAGRVCDGALCRLQPAEVPRQGPRDGEDCRPDAAVGHFPNRLPRCQAGGRRARLHRLCRRRRPRWPRLCRLVPPAGRGVRDRRGRNPNEARAGSLLRLRDDRHHERR
mmetsp:Transcript_47989/g.159034  ORF Transcript_47989/g.159034 Transcript_47989/m.159034 type:complete len:281 (+) Transcript_47989:188-1030(+)